MRFACSSGAAPLTPSIPRPRSPAWIAVSGLLTATHIGGWGFWRGFGSTLRGGTLKYLPSQEKYSSFHIFGIASTASAHMSLVSSGSQLKPPSSFQVWERPVPNSRRPLLIRSIAAAVSAVRTGWLNGGSSRRMPKPMRMFFVCAAHAVRKTSEAEQCEYSSRK